MKNRASGIHASGICASQGPPVLTLTIEQTKKWTENLKSVVQLTCSELFGACYVQIKAANRSVLEVRGHGVIHRLINSIYSF